MTLKEIKDELEEYPSIRIQGLLRKRKETLEEFIIKFFEKWNNEKDTINIDTGEVDTEAGCRRSLGDLYKICSYYYPKCTFIEVKDILWNIVFEKLTRFRSSYCNSTERRMFYRGDDFEKTGVLNTTHHCEFGLTVEQMKNLH